MQLIIIYQTADANKNREYIALYENECKRRGLDFSLIITGAPDCGVTCFNERFNDLKAFPDDTFFINRSRDAALTRHLEAAGFKVYNNSLIAELGNDKLKAIRYMEEADIPVMKTFTSPPTSYPFVMKTIDGHGGNEVFLINNNRELAETEASLSGRKLLYQEYCDTPGRDKRVYIVGNKVVACMLRTSSEDFRSNYSLGGNAAISELTPEESVIIKKLLSRLSIGHAGIDLIYHKGQPVFNEIEDVVGSRMLYRYTDIDVVKLFMDHICENL